jgi:hypothetical protein
MTNAYIYAAGWIGSASRYRVVDSTTMKACINMAGIELCKFYGAAQRRDSSNATTSGKERYSLPADFYLAKRIAIITANTGLEVDLQEMDAEKIGLYRDNTGAPTFYRIWNGKIQIVPVNATSDTLIIEYYASNKQLSAATDTSNIDQEFLDFWAVSAAEKGLIAKRQNNDSITNQRLITVQELLKLETERHARIDKSYLERITK